MDLLEYQAKELFREVGIPVLPAQRIDRPTDLKNLTIPYPVVLKSQVPIGGRGKAGGIRLVENTIDAIATARTIFNLPIRGKYPELLLAESHYDADLELYLAVILDYGIGCPVLLGSCHGGMNLETAIAYMQKVIVERDFSPFYARRLALKMGVQGNLIESVSQIVQKMYQLFIQKDLDLVEINPLGINITGEVMALDGKIAVNDRALSRHLELAALGLNQGINQGVHPGVSNLENKELNPLAILDSTQVNSKPKELKWTDGNGNIGIVCNSNCLAAATLDLIYQAKGKPASCLVVNGYASWEFQSLSSPVQQLQIALEQLIENPAIQVVLVNIFCNGAASQAVAKVIENYLLAQIEETPVINVVATVEKQMDTILRSRRAANNRKRIAEPTLTGVNQLPQFVIRLVGENINLTKEDVAALPLRWIDDLDKAVAQVISLAKSGVN
ncbi:MAG TPA: ATPase [Cyanobacteria bacterium UBA11159]|nr:ATPase [Cyanobacteria bacterium UBA11367]HBE58348.1 ATPase [Cyanobacteria bacterium UBA11366]HBK62055.1 ATPase [Cyanobacteria bacterium UBA11166]HBR73885.1 ATPase [Cyanobacteria bacterium UBA11159]HBS71197.1 ATPase [Cyanobacteria bacterium UBA11153]HCA94697.1 ATPase [Cyanobacteria bacterium UBA9226]